MTIKITPRDGFTLIELLVVISIIAILAATSVPVYQSVMMGGKQTAALNNARQIGLGVRMYANDNDGNLPSVDSEEEGAASTSNDAFRQLVPTYVDSEQIFTVPSSKVGAKADNDVSTKSKILERNENHWAYVAGLSTSSKSTWPLIVDHTTGSGYYSDKEGDVGGTWRGTKAVVVHADNSAKLIKLLGTGSRMYIPRADDSDKNALTVRDYMGDSVRLLEPAK
ncbi:MAG: type II secretion system protein [Chthoniobacteraceae bacterium]